MVFVTLASRKDDVNCYAKSVDCSRMSVSSTWSPSGRVVEPAHPINLAVGSPTPQNGVIFGARTLFLNNIQSRVPLLGPHHSHRKITVHWPVLTALVRYFHNLRNLECFLVVFAIRYRER